MSSIKEKVVNESIKRIRKRLAEIDRIMDSKPLSEIVEGRIKAQAILKQHKGDYKKISELIEPLAIKEKELFKLAKKQNSNRFDFIGEKVELGSQLSELYAEKYSIDQKKLRITRMDAA